MNRGASGDQGHHRHPGFEMPHDGQQSCVGGAGAEAGPNHTLVVPFDHASDGAVDSELPEARCGLVNEPDAPPNPFDGVRIGVLPGQPGCQGPELAAAEVGVSDVADGN